MLHTKHGCFPNKQKVENIHQRFWECLSSVHLNLWPFSEKSSVYFMLLILKDVSLLQKVLQDFSFASFSSPICSYQWVSSSGGKPVTA